jgi:hypothetical protein
VAIALASIDDTAHSVTLTLDPVRHGTLRGATVERRDAHGERVLTTLPPGATTVRVEVAAREGVLLVLRSVR